MYDDCRVMHECVVLRGDSSSIGEHKLVRVPRVDVHLVSGVHDTNVVSRDVGASRAMSVLGVEAAREQAAPAPDSIAVRRVVTACAAQRPHSHIAHAQPVRLQEVGRGYQSPFVQY